ncbi:MFS transporter [Pinibacter soli]|uniref:MFS transporter n=1 Tax=Pinibacter soli TaxID=3044211 RepID=A0ABT6R730_9BACT|nr:MFS transporter [Pinibacter soli]MDI3318372.1 MFS transporter [Pinibacter soli]
MENTRHHTIKLLFQTPVIVAALGYFVDIYDLLLFGIVRKPSLQAIGYQGQDVLDKGILLINIQMIGLLIGGILWGIIGDKKGRLSVLFGSILLYSAANLLNGFVTDINQYAVLRFVAGVGLAGELGAGITLVAEILPKKIRGFGTTLIAAVGLLGAVFAYFVASYTNWHAAYVIGGSLGLCLLLLRIKVSESAIYKNTGKHPKIVRGDFLSLFTNAKRFLKYIRCIVIGLPVWFVIGILITFSPEIAAILGISGVDAGKSIMFCYIGLSIGDLSSGLISQWLQSRKKAVAIFMILSGISMFAYLSLVSTLTGFYAACLFVGFSVGYWAMFVTIAAEQFGTELRSTVATTVPNFVRGAVVVLTLLFRYIAADTNMLFSAWIVGFATLTAAVLALWKMDETFHKDLDFLEVDHEHNKQKHTAASFSAPVNTYKPYRKKEKI